MIDRINLILKAKNITAKQFAEEIGIQPSGMSHILGGRNNPSLDFVMKVIRRYPEIDINWLMFGKGEMYENPATSIHAVPNKTQGLEKQQSATAATAQPVETAKSTAEAMPDLFSGINVEPRQAQASNYQNNEAAMSPKVQEVPRTTPQQMQPSSAPAVNQPVANVPPSVPQQGVYPQLHENGVNESGRPPVHEYSLLTQKKIVKVVILYEDHSFSEYYPER